MNFQCEALKVYHYYYEDLKDMFCESELFILDLLNNIKKKPLNSHYTWATLSLNAQGITSASSAYGSLLPHVILNAY